MRTNSSGQNVTDSNGKEVSYTDSDNFWRNLGIIGIVALIVIVIVIKVIVDKKKVKRRINSISVNTLFIFSFHLCIMSILNVQSLCILSSTKCYKIVALQILKVYNYANGEDIPTNLYWFNFIGGDNYEKVIKRTIGYGSCYEFCNCYVSVS